MKTLPPPPGPGLQAIFGGTEPGGEAPRTRRMELIVVSAMLGAIVA
jgi:hypothetical protein